MHDTGLVCRHQPRCHIANDVECGAYREFAFLLEHARQI